MKRSSPQATKHEISTLPPSVRMCIAPCRSVLNTRTPAVCNNFQLAAETYARQSTVAQAEPRINPVSQSRDARIAPGDKSLATPAARSLQSQQTPAQPRKHAARDKPLKTRQHNSNQQGSNGCREEGSNEDVSAGTVRGAGVRLKAIPAAKNAAIAMAGTFIQPCVIEPWSRCETSAGINQTCAFP